ncbi:ABC transporter permease [Patescibacteria group bacterium]|nr:ABC transporter permease [Patescibacteria group bacterium]
MPDSVTIKRILRAGFLDFWRNGFVSLASILVMTVTLFVVGTTLFAGVMLQSTLATLRDKADVTVYFTTSAPEEKVLQLQKTLQALPQVQEVTYTSAEDALTAFRSRHQNDQLTLQALQELGDNPLGAELDIKAKDISQYDAIAQFLQQQQQNGGGGASIIDKINYFDQQHRQALDRLQEITDSAGRIGLIVILILVGVTIAISFNTLRLAIYTSREEIQVMRLVGAGQFYIRAPFMVEGVLYGLISGVITLLLLYPVTYWMGTATQSFFGGINVFSYYLSHFFFFFAIIIGTGVLLGAVASYLAVRRYLKI